MQVSRRDALATGAAAITTAAIAAPLAIKSAGVKAALAGEEAQDEEVQTVMALFQQMGDGDRAAAHFWINYVAGLPDNPEFQRRWIADWGVRP